MNKPDSSQQRHLDGVLPAEQIGDQTTPATAASTKDEVNKVLQATSDTLQPVDESRLEQVSLSIHEIMRAQLDYAVAMQEAAAQYRAWEILASDLQTLSVNQVQQHLQRQPSIADDLWFNLSQITLWQSTSGGVPDAVLQYQQTLEYILPMLQQHPAPNDSAIIYAAYGLWLRVQTGNHTTEQLLNWLDHTAKPTVSDEWKNYRHVVRLQKWLGISRAALEHKQKMQDAQRVSTDDLPRRLRFEDTDLFTDEDMEDLDRTIVAYCVQDIEDDIETEDTKKKKMKQKKNK